MNGGMVAVFQPAVKRFNQLKEMAMEHKQQITFTNLQSMKRLLNSFKLNAISLKRNHRVIKEFGIGEVGTADIV